MLKWTFLQVINTKKENYEKGDLKNKFSLLKIFRSINGLFCNLEYLFEFNFLIFISFFIK
jgi:hypothetical protein